MIGRTMTGREAMDAPPAGYMLAGAVVRRSFDFGGGKLPIGHVISAEDYAELGRSGRAMVKCGWLTMIHVAVDRATVPLQGSQDSAPVVASRATARPTTRAARREAARAGASA